MRRSLIAAFLFTLGPGIHAQTLKLPPRPASALSGTEFARSIIDVSRSDRERKILEAVTSGNVPNFLRTFVPVTVHSGTIKATYSAAPDYLAIGSDDD